MMLFAGPVNFELPLWLSLLILGMFVAGIAVAAAASGATLFGLQQSWQEASKAEKNSPRAKSVYMSRDLSRRLRYLKAARFYSVFLCIVASVGAIAQSKGNYETADKFMNSLFSPYGILLGFIAFSVIGYLYTNYAIRKMFS